MRLVDARRHAATGLRSIASAGLAPRTLRMLLQRLGKRCRLAISCPARLIELSLEVVHLLTQSLVLSAQDFSLALRTLQTLAEHGRVRRWALVVSRDSRLRHAPVMPESRLLYKRR